MNHIQINSKLRLERIRPHMAQTIFEAVETNREFLEKWIPFVNETDHVSYTEKYIQAIISQKGKPKDDVYTIWYNQIFAGLIGFKDTDWINNKTELGYWLVEKLQGKGIITSCVKELVDLAFKKMGMNRVQIKTALGNSKSAAIPKRLGFHFEGIERQGENHHGKYTDLEVYSFLKSDFMIF